MPVIGSGKVGLALFPIRQMIISLVLERLISSLFVADQSLMCRNSLTARWEIAAGITAVRSSAYFE